MDYTIRVAAFPALAKQYPQEVRRATEWVLQRIVTRMEAEVVKRTPRGVGGAAGLAGSIAGRVFSYGRVVRGMVGSPLEYSECVEMGTKPHFPPLSPLELWVRRILGLEGKEARSVAFAIAVKISKEGTKGAKMFEKSFEEMDKWIMDQINKIPGIVERSIL